MFLIFFYYYYVFISLVTGEICEHWKCCVLLILSVKFQKGEEINFLFFFFILNLNSIKAKFLLS